MNTGSERETERLQRMHGSCFNVSRSLCAWSYVLVFLWFFFVFGLAVCIPKDNWLHFHIKLQVVKMQFGY